MPSEITQTAFNYSSLDEATAIFLKTKEDTIRVIAGNAYTLIGQHLKESQDRLALNRHGCFQEWVESIGFKKQTAYKLIQRYNLIVHNMDNRNLIEDLPLSLSYEISKPSADPETVKKVFDGDITDHKQYQEALKAKKEAEVKTKELEKALALEKTKQPVVPADYYQLKQSVAEFKKTIKEKENAIADKESLIAKLQKQKDSLEKQAKLNEQAASKYFELTKQIERLTKQKDDISRQIDAATSLSGLIVKIDAFIKNELAPIKYSRAIAETRNDETVQRNLAEILERVQAWIDEMWSILRGESEIIISGREL
jgi:hypothetical protein